MLEDEFDIGIVHRLVDQAMGKGSTKEPDPVAHPSTIRVPFTVTDTRLLEELSKTLSKLDMHPADIQMAIGSVRDNLCQDLDFGVLKDLHSLTLNCKRCPNLGGASIPIGNLNDPDIIFVSDYAVSEWPESLLELTNQVGLDSARAALTFTTRCRPAVTRQATTEEVANCSNYLYSELQMLRPKLIIALGSIAGSAFLDPLKISDDHGIIFWSGPWAIMPVYALGYLGRKETAEKEMLIDLTKAKQFLYGM